MNVFAPLRSGRRTYCGKTDSLEVQEKVNLDKKVLSLFWAVQGGGSGENVWFGFPASDMGNSGLCVVVKAREESEGAPCPTCLYQTWWRILLLLLLPWWVVSVCLRLCVFVQALPLEQASVGRRSFSLSINPKFPEPKMMSSNVLIYPTNSAKLKDMSVYYLEILKYSHLGPEDNVGSSKYLALTNCYWSFEFLEQVCRVDLCPNVYRVSVKGSRNSFSH